MALRRTPRFFTRILTVLSQVYQIILDASNWVIATITEVPEYVTNMDDLKIDISWEEVPLTEEALANGDGVTYEVRRKETGQDADFVTIATDLIVTTFTDQGDITPNAEYEYKIVATDKFGSYFGQQTAPQPVGELTVVAPEYGYDVFQTPETAVISNITGFTSTTVSLGWEAPPVLAEAELKDSYSGITYRIKRSTDGAPYELIDVGIELLEYTDLTAAPNTSYEYRVIAEDQFGHKTAPQAIGDLSVLTLHEVEEDEPYDRQPISSFTADTKVNGNVLLTWDAIVDADPALEYIIERRILNSGDAMVEITRGVESTFVDFNGEEGVDYGDRLGFVDETVVADTEYEYAIYAELETQDGVVDPLYNDFVVFDHRGSAVGGSGTSIIDDVTLEGSQYHVDGTLPVGFPYETETAWWDYVTAGYGEYKVFYVGVSIDGTSPQENWIEVADWHETTEHAFGQRVTIDGHEYIFDITSGEFQTWRVNDTVRAVPVANTRWALVKTT